ncbi:putative disease resistance protein, partial [Mucuna pruriens]
MELCYCSLSYLNLHFCENLPEFSLEGLRLHDTKVRAVPSSFGHESKLKSIILRGSHVERLPSSFNNLTELVYLDLSICNKLQTIPVLPLSLETLDLRHCGSLQSLPELPPLLETLDATHCNAHNCEQLQSLPELPLFLKSLGVNFCISLQSLPELPRISCCKSLHRKLYMPYCGSLESLPKLSPLLETLDLKHCESLQSLPELPPSLGTLNVKSVLFLNCLNLDEHSLVAIGLNEQINMMKLAYQHLSTPNHHLVGNYNNDDSDDYVTLKIILITTILIKYRGSSVPEWLEYKSTKDYIVIDLSSAQASPLLGFIFCFVLGKYRHTIGKIKCSINVKMYIDYWVWTIESDHERINKGTWKEEEETYYYAVALHVLKEFSVSRISTSTYNSFIQQMESACLFWKFNTLVICVLFFFVSVILKTEG